MPNKNYIKGRAFEYKIKKQFEAKGYLVFRTAGSHSVADLIAIPHLSWVNEWNPILIQCKATIKQNYKSEISELESIAKKYGCRALFITKKDTLKLVK